VPRSSRTALVATLTCAAWLVTTTLAVRLLTSVRVQDLAALSGFRRLDRRDSSEALRAAASVGDPLPYVLLVIGLALVLLAMARGHGRVALTIAALLCVTTVGAEALKLALNQGSLHARSFPSGHATAAFTLAICAVLATPRRFRPVAVGLGALFAVGVSYVVIALGWHSPSDVLAGFLLAATLTGVALTALLLLEERREREAPAPDTGAWTPFGVGAGVVLGGAALALASLSGVPSDVLAATVAALIAALALTLLLVFGRLAG